MKIIVALMKRGGDHGLASRLMSDQSRSQTR
ncbi:hypothetical protein Q644_05090 [Brucella intermedia 229E]|uniref:Uncharacterized protein n=1 Tax=Brucella intermedia 229E TaxID=1337887 RepID=U4V357_9HYPH|nr:hypothetical protein Q644_05090 [Brucella intermedia 229E]